MKIAFDAGHPFHWADGGIRVLSERVFNSLQKKGIDVQPVRWWDKEQKYDLLQTFYYPNNITRYSLARGVRTVAYTCLDGLTSRSPLMSQIGRFEMEFYRRFRPSVADKLGLRMSEIASGFVVPTQGEVTYLENLFGVDPAKVHTILHGVDDIYRVDRWVGGAEYLVSVGAICARKNSLLLAKVANELKIPVIFIGKLHDTDTAYLNLFQKEINNKYVIHASNVSDEEKIRYLTRARALVTLSKGESGGISNLEAIAMGVPVILPDYDWATLTYSNYVSYVHMGNFKSVLRGFTSAYMG
jgi:glycosyltransferase involved in cell wall biosynthesis